MGDTREREEGGFVLCVTVVACFFLLLVALAKQKKNKLERRHGLSELLLLLQCGVVVVESVTVGDDEVLAPLRCFSLGPSRLDGVPVAPPTGTGTRSLRSQSIGGEGENT